MAKQSTRPRAGNSKARAKRDQGLLIGSIAIIVLVFAVVLLLLINQLNTGAVTVPTGSYAQIPQTTTAEGAPVLGSPDAKITVMEFADFSCPHCLEYHPTIKSLIDNYVSKGKARLVIQLETFVGRNYSETAALAALCLTKQNRFFEMYDALFNLQETRGYQAFTLDNMKATADSLKANSSDMLACMQRQEMVKVLQSSDELFKKLGGQGVPAVYVSTDGTNYSFLSDPNSGQPVSIPQIELLGLAIDKANGAEK
jgi:protein-disulfide isomerase